MEGNKTQEMNLQKILESTNPDEIADYLLRCKREYYAGHPIISDQSYDALEDRLREFAPDHLALRKVGTDEAGKVPHSPPMLSAQKAKSVEEVIEKLKGQKVVWGFKIDGVSVKIVYRNGKLIQGATRGNGLRGENITANVLKIVNLPHNIGKMNCEVRGEAHIPLDAFKTLGDHSSPRNLAAGTLNADDPELTALRHVHFSAFDLIEKEDRDFHEKIEVLQKMGFDTADQELIDGEEIADLYSRIHAARGTYNFLMDGLTFKINDASERAKMGVTDHHPKWLIALKFPEERKSTTLEGITWQVGRQGKLTPVAELTPTPLAGATISRASLHNAAYVEEGDYAQGDEVELIRSGDIIPQVTGTVKKGPKSALIPKYCPICSEATTRQGPDLFCKNQTCRGAQYKKVWHYLRALEIEHFGPKSLAKLWDEGYIQSFEDLYKLSKPQLQETLGKNGEKIYVQLQQKKEIDLDIFLRGLSIPGVAKVTSTILAENFKTFERLQEATLEELTAIADIGEIIAQNILDYFAESKDYEALFAQGVVVKPYEPPVTVESKSFITGKAVYITGKVPDYTKKQLEELVTAHGGIWKAFSKSLDLFVIGERAGPSKLEKAKAWNLATMTAEAFLKRLNR